MVYLLILLAFYWKFMQRKIEKIDGDIFPLQVKARSKAGRKTATKIIKLAYKILQTESYEVLTMQGIAKRLGIRLSNVQYYFQSKSELIIALLSYNTQLYEARWNEYLSRVDDSPEEQFRAFLEFNFEDIKSTTTRHFFIQLWPLLSIADNYSGELLRGMYAPQLDKLVEKIKDISPAATKAEVRVRAEIIAAMIEGFIVTAPAGVNTRSHQNRLKKTMINTAFDIARGGSL
jgi:AcrR family transcriptional regulator